MDSKELRGLVEAYSEVYAPIDEGKSSRPRYSGPERVGLGPAGSERRTEKREAHAENRKGHTEGPGTVTKNPKKLRKQKAMGELGGSGKAEVEEQLDIFDVVLEFLQAKGYAETLEEAEWMMANLIDEEAVAIILGEENVNEIFGLGGRSAKDRLANSDYMKKKNKEADEKAIQNLRDMMSKDPERQKRPSRINNESFKAWLDEAMSNYEKNRKRAAQRAAARNAARDQGKTGAVPGVGYVTPRRERETWTDESGKTRHAKGL